MYSLHIDKCTSICTSMYLSEHRNCKDFAVYFIFLIIGKECTTSLLLSTLTVRTFSSLGTNQLSSLLQKALQDLLLKVHCSPERNLWASRDHQTLFGATHLSSIFANPPASAKVKVLTLFVDSVPSSHFQEEIGTKNLYLDNFARHLCCLTSLCPKYPTQILRWGFSLVRGRQFRGLLFLCMWQYLPSGLWEKKKWNWLKTHNKEHWVSEACKE